MWKNVVSSPINRPAAEPKARSRASGRGGRLSTIGSEMSDTVGSFEIDRPVVA